MTAQLARQDRIEIDGTKLEFARWGISTSGLIPIFLLHEGLGSVAFWKEFPEKLAHFTGREVIAWSRQGHGQSDLIAD